jgi:UDP-N-acetylmuramoylalanine--D-glutamate ligase
MHTLHNKNTAIFGLGREGWASYRAIRRLFPHKPLTVLNDTPLSETDSAALAQDAHVCVITGAAARDTLDNFDVIIKSPGISPYCSAFQAARDRLTSATRLWFAAHPDAHPLCITGTKGKSTSASLLAQALRAAGKRVNLGGNIGLPVWDLDENADFWVLELSSYQTSDLDAQPGVSVLLNLYPEHTDWHGDAVTYFRDKLNLLVQTAALPKIVNAADANTVRLLPELDNYYYFNRNDGFHVKAGAILRGADLILPANRLALPGAHNLSNLCAVLTTLAVLNIDLNTAMLDSLCEFRGLPHRLFVLGEKNGVRYIDDSISTTPQSTIAALSAFAGTPLTLLVGGYERQLDWTPLATFLADSPIHAVIAMGANGRRILDTLGFGEYRESLAEALRLAQDTTPPGGTVLLSPGAPSYGQFNNFQARGRKFAELAGF